MVEPGEVKQEDKVKQEDAFLNGSVHNEQPVTEASIPRFFGNHFGQGLLLGEFRDICEKTTTQSEVSHLDTSYLDGVTLPTSGSASNEFSDAHHTRSLPRGKEAT